MIHSNKRKFVFTYEELACFFYIIMSTLTGLAIAHSDSTLYSENVRHIYVYIIFISLVMAFVCIVSSRPKWTIVALIPIVYALITTLHTNFEVSGNAIFSATYDALRLIGFLLLSPAGKRIVFQYFRQFLIIMSAIGIVCFMAYILSIPLPFIQVEYYTGASNAQYINYYWLSFLFKEPGAVRLCGLFNEPGLFGTLLALVLCADGFDFRKKEIWIMFIAGCLTFSVAFFMISFVFMIIKSKDKPGLMFIFIVIFVTLFFILPMMPINSPFISAFVQRLSFDNGQFAAINRSTTFIDDTCKEVLSGSKALFGYGNGYLSSIGYSSGASTYKTEIINYGILGFLIIYGLPIFAANKRAQKKRTAFALIICFTISIYQRPFIYSLVYFVVLFGGIEYILYKAQEDL